MLKIFGELNNSTKILLFVISSDSSAVFSPHFGKSLCLILIISYENIYTMKKKKKIQSLQSQVIAINLSKADSFLLKLIYCEMKKQNNNTSFPKLLTCFGGLKPKFNMPCRNRPIYIFYSAWHGRLKLPPL